MAHNKKLLMAAKQKLTNRLKSLKDISSVSVTPSDAGDTARLEHKSHYSLDFSFRWIKTHFGGYFVDEAGSRSEAAVHLRDGTEAINFASDYSLFVALCIKK